VTDGALNGQIENLPYEVMFAMQGTSATSPWTLSLTARDVLVHEQPQILKFAPGVARRRIREFSDPKGRVDAKVDIVRTAADAPLRVVGSIDLKGLTAAFHKFPYPFRNLRGTVTFDESEVRFHNIRGEGDKGSTVVANGYIRPPTDDAEVRVEVRALGMPIDQTLRDAMEARGQEQVLDELFNVPAYETHPPRLRQRHRSQHSHLRSGRHRQRRRHRHPRIWPRFQLGRPHRHRDPRGRHAPACPAVSAHRSQRQDRAGQRARDGRRRLVWRHSWRHG
jgi:hypothetical protein